MSSTITPALEDYLEAILDVLEDNPVARVTDIAEELDVSKPRVTTVVQDLAEDGYVDHQSYGYIQLTDRGQEVAERVRERHRLLARFFSQVLDVEEEQAEDDACSAEHYISQTTLDRLTAFMRFIEECPRTGPEWLEHFRCFCENEESHESDECVEDCLRACIERLKGDHAGMCNR
ncbi:MAG: metal-dependent transcriptional regulator [Planctomycetota bacterium]